MIMHDLVVAEPTDLKKNSGQNGFSFPKFLGERFKHVCNHHLKEQVFSPHYCFSKLGLLGDFSTFCKCHMGDPMLDNFPQKKQETP